MRRQIRAFDKRIDDWIHGLPGYLRPVMLLFTLLGQPPFTVGAAAIVLGYGLAQDKSFYLFAGLIALGTIIISAILKIFLHRARPTSKYVEEMYFKTFSFPSGHAAGALVSYGMAALVISFRWPELSVLAWASAFVAIFFISFSRIYLKAHFASDIVGGWIVGGIGLIAILLLEK